MGKSQGRGMMPQALKMRCPNRVLSYLLAGALLADACSFSAQAKGYSSGGRSYSSHSSSSSSSHSFSSGSGKSFGSGSSSRSSSSGSSSSGGSRSSSSSSGSGKNFGSSSGKSYSSGSSWSGNDRHGYSSGKSYSSGSDSAFKFQSPKAKDQDIGNQKTSGGSSFSFDTAAARARKEEASKQEFTRFKDSQAPPRAQSDSAPVSGGGSYRASPPALPPRRDYYRPTYAPTTVIIQTRPRRIYDVFSPYSYRPWVVYNDPYSSLFWWWLLDRSIEDQAWWAYHHRYDMDPARYQALLNSNQQLEARVAQLEAQQAPRDPTYTPTDLHDRDLMYSDQYVNRAYANRPTASGTVAFWVFAVPAAAGGCIFFIWLIWFKRWQTT